MALTWKQAAALADNDDFFNSAYNGDTMHAIMMTTGNMGLDMQLAFEKNNPRVETTPVKITISLLGTPTQEVAAETQKAIMEKARQILGEDVTVNPDDIILRYEPMARLAGQTR